MTTDTFVQLVRQMAATGDSPMALRNDYEATASLADIQTFCKATGQALGDLSDKALASLYELG